MQNGEEVSRGAHNAKSSVQFGVLLPNNGSYKLHIGTLCTTYKSLCKPKKASRSEKLKYLGDSQMLH